MGSHLHIGKLPVTEFEGTELKDIEEVSGFYEHKLQFTNNREIILSINELEILLKNLYLVHKLKYRRLKEDLKIAIHCLEYKDDLITVDGELLIELLKNIRSEIGYNAKDIKFDDLYNSIKKLEIALESLNVSDEIYNITEIISWAKKHFIEGEHYLYTL